MLRAFILVVFSVSLSFQAEHDNFFPHGSDNGDRTLSQGNDESLEIIPPEDVLFPYFGETYSNIFIHTNGLISFNQAWPKPQSSTYRNTFPLYPDLNNDNEDEVAILIAPFWADVDTSSQRGAVTYRQIQASDDIGHASNIVRRNFPSYPTFVATWVLIVTWNEVSFYNHDTTSQTDPRNTFQSVLITDGQESFVFCFYDTIEWTTGTTLSGNEVTGITTTDVHQAILGFNKGDGFKSFTDGFPSKRADLPQVSNINEPGSYAYQVNRADIVAAGCSQGVADFSTFPAFGSILGGQKLFLYGPCWDGTNDLKCQFWTKDDQPKHLQSVNGTIENKNTAYCVPNPFFLVGEVEIRVSVDGGNSFTQSGVYRILNLDRVAVSETVTRQKAQDDIWYTAGNDLSIAWPKDAFSSTVDIHVLNYDEEGEAGPRWQEVFTIGTNMENDGSHVFRTVGLENVTSATAFGVIRIQPSKERFGLKLYSDIHNLGYLLEQAFQDDPNGWAKSECQTWVDDENRKADFTKKLESCPCTLNQALADTARFYSDLECNMFNNNECILHGEAKHCVISIFPSEDNSGNECCYDIYGNLMYAGDYSMGMITVGSISHRAHIAGSSPYMVAGTVPMLSHFKADMLPFFYCCILGNNCMKYLNRRPTADCFNYQLPKSAALLGDPHFFTFDGANFTFNGKGDYTLIRYDAGGSNFHLYGRLEVIKAGYPKDFGQEADIGGTGLTAVVMTEDGATAISVMTSVITGIDIQKGKYDSQSDTVSDWSTVDFQDQTWLDFDDVGVSINHVEGYSRITSVTVIFSGSRIGVNVTRGVKANSILAISPILPPHLMNDDSLVGLLGNWNNNTKDDLKRTNGDSLNFDDTDAEEIFQYAATWETTLTTIFRHPYPEEYKNESSYIAVLDATQGSALTTSEKNILTQTCADNEPCRFDYLVTRNRDLAEDTRREYEAFQWAQNNTRKVIVCRYIAAPDNGTKTYLTKHDTGDITDNQNNFVGTQIIFECNDDLTLTGSESRVCEKHGWYSGSEGINECIATPCGTLPSVRGGSISIELSEVGDAVATVTCDEGYALTGGATHECVEGSWTGGTSACEATGGVNAAVVAGSTIGAFFFVAIVVGIIVIAVVFVRKNKHKPSSKTQMKKYETVDAEDMNATDNEYGDTKPTPAPRSTQSDGEQMDENYPLNDTSSNVV